MGSIPVRRPAAGAGALIIGAARRRGYGPHGDGAPKRPATFA